MPKATAPKKFGKIELPINSSEVAEHLQFVPKDNEYVDQNKILEAIAYAIEARLPVLIIGETGTGKTSAIRYLAQETNNAFRRLNLNGSTSVDEFVGKILINEKGTYWVDGVLVDAMRHGHWLLIDEINAGLPEILFVLQSLLDDDGYVLLSDKPDREIVRPHPNFRLFATCNPSDNYAGTKEMNKALLSRFSIVLDAPFPTRDKEIAIMKSKFADLNEVLAGKMVDFANQQRKAYKEHKVDFVFSTRELINWYKVQQDFTKGNVKLAARYAVLAKCNDTDREAFESIIDLQFKEQEGTYTGPFKFGTRFETTAEITPYQAKNISIPTGSVLEVMDEPVDRGGKIGVAIRVKLVRPGPFDPAKLTLPPKEQFGLRLEDLEANSKPTSK